MNIQGYWREALVAKKKMYNIGTKLALSPPPGPQHRGWQSSQQQKDRLLCFVEQSVDEKCSNI
jgi:hypothetical protein